MPNNLSTLMESPAALPRWLVVLAVVVPLVIAGLVVVAVTSPFLAPGADSARPIPGEVQQALLPMFAWVFCGGAFGVSLLVLVICLPLYLFSTDKGRIRRAGGLVKTSLGFIVTSAAGILATYSF